MPGEIEQYINERFNPWYVGGGVKRRRSDKRYVQLVGVSILGMLEGVLKEKLPHNGKIQLKRFNPWYVGGGVKSTSVKVLLYIRKMFQSLVCWRGC